MLKVVIDTNVLVSALLKPDSNPARIISLVMQQQLTLCLSKAILDEYKGVLGYGKFAGLDRAASQRLLAKLKKHSLWITPGPKIEAIGADPSDNKFLECAVAGNADYIISGDYHLKDLKTFGRSQIVDPGVFLLNFIQEHLKG
jgi:putative PIN family toxin of toxin-antitoxin system